MFIRTKSASMIYLSFFKESSLVVYDLIKAVDSFFKLCANDTTLYVSVEGVAAF